MLPRLWFRALAVTLALVAALALALPEASPAAAESVNDESDFLARINQSRASAGLPALAMHPSLVREARAHADRMAAQGGIYHRPDLSAGVDLAWQRIGENVGMGASTPPVHDAFLNSPPHRANILGDFNQAGIGVTWSGGTLYVTEIFVKDSSGSAVKSSKPRRARASRSRRSRRRSAARRGRSSARRGVRRARRR